jgi:methanogenic corrinoid protein MtbC1
VPARHYADALRVGDGTAVEGLIARALALGWAPAAIHAGVIEPALVEVGELWAQGTLSIADEHLATAISERALVRLFAHLTTGSIRSREKVLLAAIEGERHVIGLRMVADVLEGAGFDVLYLGADVPLASLRGFAAEHQPAVVGLTASVTASEACVAETICVLHDVTPQSRLMFGGRGLPAGFRRTGYPVVESSLDVLAAVERMLAGDATPPTRAVMALRARGACERVQGHAEHRDLATARMAEAARDATDVARDYVRLAARRSPTRSGQTTSPPGSAETSSLWSSGRRGVLARSPCPSASGRRSRSRRRSA